jgi:hypothetical protein
MMLFFTMLLHDDNDNDNDSDTFEFLFTLSV